MKKALYIFIVLGAVAAILLAFGRKHIETEVVIDAPVDAVWAGLTDFGSYPDWNPFLREVSGEVKRGNRIRVTFHAKGSDPVVFTPVVLVYEKNAVFQWEGRLVFPGIFTGRHTFELTALDGGKTRLVQKEDFNGVLVPFFSFDSTVEGFSLMNRELKKRVEQKAVE